jgi:hypothetical protein
MLLTLSKRTFEKKRYKFAQNLLVVNDQIPTRNGWVGQCVAGELASLHQHSRSRHILERRPNKGLRYVSIWIVDVRLAFWPPVSIIHNKVLQILYC